MLVGRKGAPCRVAEHRLGRRRKPRAGDPTSPEPVDPALASILRSRLAAMGADHLLGAVDSLRVVARCSCGDPSCASFYAISPTEARWLWGKGGRTIQLGEGLAIDVVNGLIVAVELVRAKAAT